MCPLFGGDWILENVLDMKKQFIYLLIALIGFICLGAVTHKSESYQVVQTDGSLTGDGFDTPLGINTSDRLSAYIPITGSKSQALVAGTTITVTIGTTMANNTYQVNVTPTSAISAALYYVSNKTTTTFDVVYLAGITGTVTFDYSIFQ